MNVNHMNPVRQNFMSQVMAKLTIDRGNKILNEESANLTPEQTDKIRSQIERLQNNIDQIA